MHASTLQSFQYHLKPFCSGAHSRRLYCSGTSSNDGYLGHFKIMIDWLTDWLIDWLIDWSAIALLLQSRTVTAHSVDFDGVYPPLTGYLSLSVPLACTTGNSAALTLVVVGSFAFPGGGEGGGVARIFAVDGVAVRVAGVTLNADVVHLRRDHLIRTDSATGPPRTIGGLQPVAFSTRRRPYIRLSRPRTDRRRQSSRTWY